MEAKLIKVENTFYLKQGGTILGTSSYPNLSASIRYSLSLENCQAVERGYDLDELALEAFELDLNCQGDCNNYYERLAYKLGMIKMIKLLGDKKFSEEDVKFAFNKGYLMKFNPSAEYRKTLNDLRQSLQQTEWDCIVEMEGPLVYPANLPKDGEERPDYKPKLDERGRLILKRK